MGYRLEACPYPPTGLKNCSYGFRPNRNAHGAVKALTRAVDWRMGNWILEFDVETTGAWTASCGRFTESGTGGSAGVANGLVSTG